MKIKRFVSVFLLCACLAGLLLTPAASAAEVPDIQAKAALLADVNTDAVAYGKNIHEKNYPASLTKVMTALLVLERASGDEALLSEPVTASESAFSDTYYHVDGSSAGILVGETMSLQDLLYCAMLSSGNDACNVIAEYIGGTCKISPRKESSAVSSAALKTGVSSVLMTSPVTSPVVYASPNRKDAS